MPSSHNFNETMILFRRHSNQLNCRNQINEFINTRLIATMTKPQWSDYKREEQNIRKVMKKLIEFDYDCGGQSLSERVESE